VDASLSLLVGSAAACDATPRVCTTSVGPGSPQLSWSNSAPTTQQALVIIDTPFPTSLGGAFAYSLTTPPPGDNCSQPLALMPGVATAATLTGLAPAGTLLLLAGLRSDALGILIHGQVELREPGRDDVLEIRGAGDCWGDAPFLNRDASAVDVRTRTPVEYIEVTRDQFSDLVRVHPSMATSLAALVARKNRKSRPALPPEKPSDLAGKIEVVPIADLVQVLHLCRKSGHLRLTDASRRGGLYVANGELKHAWTDETEGEEALYTLMGWSDGTFVFESGAAAGVVTLTQPTMMLVMESARRVDERRRAEAAGPETT